MGEKNSSKVSSLFTADEVACGLKAMDRAECVRLLAKRLEKRGAVADGEAVAREVMGREELGPTIVAPGLAVPHARMEGQEQIVIAVGTSPEGIRFGAAAEAPVKLVVMIVTGAHAPGAYLKVLSAVVRVFANPSVIEKVARIDTAEGVWEFFDKGAGVLPAFVTAGDMMNANFVALKNTDTLSKAIDVFCRHRVARIPILDGDGDFAGIVGEEEVLKLSLPEYILWLDDLKPILQFEPFGQTLRDEHVTRLAEIMSSDFVTVSEDTPAIQVARELMLGKVREVFVTRGKKLIGTIRLHDLLQRVFRG